MIDELLLVPCVEEDSSVGGRGMKQELGGALGGFQMCSHQIGWDQIIIDRAGDDCLGRHVLGPQHELVPQKLTAERLQKARHVRCCSDPGSAFQGILAKHMLTAIENLP